MWLKMGLCVTRSTCYSIPIQVPSIGGTLLTGGVGYVLGTFIAVMALGTIRTYLTLDGSLTPWWIKIVIGVLLFAFIGLQKFLSSRQGIFGLNQQAEASKT